MADKPLAEQRDPKLLVEQLVAVMAPVVREIAKRSLAPTELVLKRQTGDGRREEIFVARRDLQVKLRAARAGGARGVRAARARRVRRPRRRWWCRRRCGRADPKPAAPEKPAAASGPRRSTRRPPRSHCSPKGSPPTNRLRSDPRAHAAVVACGKDDAVRLDESLERLLVSEDVTARKPQ